MNILSKIALTGLVLSMSSLASAATSISGSTDFRVTLPEILVLYHWDDAHLTLSDVATTPTNDNDPREISDTADHDFTGTLDNSTFTIVGPAVNTDPVITGNTVSVVLQDSWAVRSLSSDDVNLGLTVQEATLKNVTENASTIAVENAMLTFDGNDAISQDIPSKWTPTLGDIKFDLNLTNATKSGEYNTRGAAGAALDSANGTDTFLLTLTGN